LAARLASYPSAPKPVLERLAREVIEVAGPILEHSPCPAELKAAAEARGGAHAETAATRAGNAVQTGRVAGRGLRAVGAVLRSEAAGAPTDPDQSRLRPARLIAAAPRHATHRCLAPGIGRAGTQCRDAHWGARTHARRSAGSSAPDRQRRARRANRGC